MKYSDLLAVMLIVSGFSVLIYSICLHVVWALIGIIIACFDQKTNRMCQPHSLKATNIVCMVVSQFAYVFM